MNGVVPKAGRRARLWTIDTLRGAAALGVVMFHSSSVTGIARSSLPGQILDGVLTWGRYGVWLFFVLSGFCIHLRWAERAREGDVAPPDFLGFWRRRIRRLYPPYLVALALYVALRAWCGISFGPHPLVTVALHTVMLHNVEPHAMNGVNEVFWTLAIEEQLYLLYFVFLRVRVRYRWAGALALGAAARIGWFGFALILHRGWQIDISVTQSAAAQWLVWMLGALAVEALVGTIELPVWLTWGPVAAALLTCAASISYVYLYVLDAGALRNVCWLLTDVVWGLGCFVLVNRIVKFEARRPAVLGSGLAAIGLFSYSLYLTHELITFYAWRLVGPIVVGAAGPISSLLLVPALTLASVALARVYFAAFERPFLSPPLARPMPV